MNPLPVRTAVELPGRPRRRTRVQITIAIDGLGRRRGELNVGTRTAGPLQLRRWAEQLGTQAVWAIEGTGSANEDDHTLPDAEPDGQHPHRRERLPPAPLLLALASAPPGHYRGPAPSPSGCNGGFFNTGIIMVAGQGSWPPVQHQSVTVLVSDTILAIELTDGGVKVVRRTTTPPVRSIKGQRPGTATAIS